MSFKTSRVLQLCCVCVHLLVLRYPVLGGVGGPTDAGVRCGQGQEGQGYQPSHRTHEVGHRKLLALLVQVKSRSDATAGAGEVLQ